jgi:hypothetical protein
MGYGIGGSGPVSNPPELRGLTYRGLSEPHRAPDPHVELMFAHARSEAAIQREPGSTTAFSSSSKRASSSQTD